MWQDLFIGGKDWEAYWLPQKSCHTFPHFFHHTIRHRAAPGLTSHDFLPILKRRRRHHEKIFSRLLRFFICLGCKNSALRRKPFDLSGRSLPDG
jgi:hypothetical protein